MRGKRLGVVGKLAGRIAVDFDHFAAEGFQQHRHNDSTAGVDGIHRHFESTSTHRIAIHQGQGQGVRDVLFHPIGSSSDPANGIHVDILCRGIGEFQHPLSCRSTQKLTGRIQQLQRVPLPRVVACGQNDTAVGLLSRDRQLHCRRGAQAQIHDIDTGGVQRAHQQVPNQLST